MSTAREEPMWRYDSLLAEQTADVLRDGFVGEHPTSLNNSNTSIGDPKGPLLDPLSVRDFLPHGERKGIWCKYLGSVHPFEHPTIAFSLAQPRQFRSVTLLTNLALSSIVSLTPVLPATGLDRPLRVDANCRPLRLTQAPSPRRLLIKAATTCGRYGGMRGTRSRVPRSHGRPSVGPRPGRERKRSEVHGNR